MPGTVEFRQADSLELESLLRDGYDDDVGQDGQDFSHPPSSLKKVSKEAHPASSPATSKRTPVPWLQVGFIAIWRMSQSLYFICIFPFINSMLVEMGVANEITVGKYSGLIEAAAAMGVCIGVFVFAPISDKYGRKWVTILGVLAASVLCALFGFGQTFGQLLFLRFAMGFANGAQSATAKVMVSEMCDASNEALSFAVMGTGWQLGATAAPVAGAILANPAKTWPSLFSGTVWERYPYALPPVVVAILPGVACFFAVCFSHETHPDIRAGRRRAGYSKVLQSPSDLETKMETPEAEPGILSCGAPFILFIRGLLMVQAVWSGSTELLLFFSSSNIGGLGLTQVQMSVFLSARPLLTTLFTLLVCPWLFARYNSVQILRGAVLLCPVAASLYFTLAWLAGIGQASTFAIVGILAIILVVQTAGNPAYLTSNVIVNCRAPSRAHLSRMNAWSELVNQATLSFGASVGSAVFAWSNEHQILPGKLSWICLICITVFQAIITQKVTHVDGWRERAAALEA